MASAAVLSTFPQRRSPSPTATSLHRLSGHSAVSSSAASFQTAPLTASSSAQTINANREPNLINPIHNLSQRPSQEVHIVKVTNDTVRIEKGPVADSYFSRIMAGPLPPSPPASIERESFGKDERVQEDQFYADQASFDEPTPVIPQRLHRASTETKASMRTIIGPSTHTTNLHPPAPPPAANSKSAAHLSADGYLQPPPLSMHRPTRRNTIGSTPKSPQAISATPSVPGELESDIQLHAENIRRERLSKRAKAQQEAEAAMTREKDTAPDVVLVGNLIGEDHVNYVLMYNMLTGIRIGVGALAFTFHS